MDQRGARDLVEQRLARAREVMRLEAGTIARLEQGLGASFSDVVGMVLACHGKVVVTGMGKAGIVGQKISATLASTGTPSIFLHPAEALHGDLGRIRPDDLVLALSNSGETSEVNQVIPVARKIGARVVAMTGQTDSTLARLADRVLDIGRVDEACPLGLAPTASTSAMLALGDALAMVVLSERNFGREDYALYHPAGALGRRLMRVSEVMRKDDELPLCPAGTSLAEVLRVMGATPGRPGAALIIGPGREAGRDLHRRRPAAPARRTARSAAASRSTSTWARTPRRSSPTSSSRRPSSVLREHRIDQIAVIDERGSAVGLLDVQDLLDTRL